MLRKNRLKTKKVIREGISKTEATAKKKTDREDMKPSKSFFMTNSQRKKPVNRSPSVKNQKVVKPIISYKPAARQTATSELKYSQKYAGNQIPSKSLLHSVIEGNCLGKKKLRVSTVKSKKEVVNINISIGTKNLKQNNSKKAIRSVSTKNLRPLLSHSSFDQNPAKGSFKKSGSLKSLVGKRWREESGVEASKSPRRSKKGTRVLSNELRHQSKQTATDSSSMLHIAHRVTPKEEHRRIPPSTTSLLEAEITQPVDITKKYRHETKNKDVVCPGVFLKKRRKKNRDQLAAFLEDLNENSYSRLLKLIQRREVQRRDDQLHESNTTQQTREVLPVSSNSRIRQKRKSPSPPPSPLVVSSNKTPSLEIGHFNCISSNHKNKSRSPPGFSASPLLHNETSRIGGTILSESMENINLSQMFSSRIIEGENWRMPPKSILQKNNRELLQETFSEKRCSLPGEPDAPLLQSFIENPSLIVTRRSELQDKSYKPPISEEEISTRTNDCLQLLLDKLIKELFNDPLYTTQSLSLIKVKPECTNYFFVKRYIDCLVSHALLEFGESIRDELSIPPIEEAIPKLHTFYTMEDESEIFDSIQPSRKNVLPQPLSEIINKQLGISGKISTTFSSMLFDCMNEILASMRVEPSQGEMLPHIFLNLKWKPLSIKETSNCLSLAREKLLTIASYMCGFIPSKKDSFLQLPSSMDDEMVDQIKEDRLYKLLQKEIQENESQSSRNFEESYGVYLELSIIIFQELFEDLTSFLLFPGNSKKPISNY